MIHVLFSESLDIFFNKKEISLVSFNWVAEIIFVDIFLVISQEWTDCLDARCWLQILWSQKLIKVLLERGSRGVNTHFKHLNDSHENLLESFEVPILIDNSVNNSWKEDLLSFVSEKIHKVVHLIDGFKVTHILLTPLRKKLLSNQEDKHLDIFVVCKINVLLWIFEGHFDFVHQRSAHWQDHSLSFSCHKS